MAAYYKVDVVLNSQAVQVGLPSPQSVRVTLPNRGPQGLQGVQGEVGPIGPVGETGSPGADGREVELQTTETHVQWRYEGESEWIDLVALSAITGPQGIQGETGLTGAAGADGREVELRKTETHVQWRYEDEAEYTDLIALTEITGPQGQTGNQGPAGPANTLAIGTVTTGAAGSSADATITGESPAQTLNLVIPRGDKGDQGDQGPPGPATTDASDLTTGTLADARLSSNVPRLDAANTYSANQTLDGTNNVAPNQTAASDSSLMTRALVDRRIVSPSIIHFREDFLYFSATGGYGETRWDGGTSGGSLAYQNATNASGRAGAWLMTTGSGTWARLRKTAQSTLNASGKAFEYVAICKLQQTTNIQFGFGGNSSVSITQNFPAFVFDDAVSANWYFHGADTGYAATTDWVYLRAFRYATSGDVSYEIRDSEFGTQRAAGSVTDTISSNQQDFGFTVNAPSGQTAAAMVDYAALWMTAPTR
jgi:hypothetical protein